MAALVLAAMAGTCLAMHAGQVRALHGVLTSPKNPAVKALRRLEQRRHREAEGLVLLEGVRLVADALAAGCEPTAVLVTEAVLGEHAELRRACEAMGEGVVSLADERAVAAACTTVTPQGVVAAVRRPAPLARAPDGASLVLVLDGVSDPGNVGTLVRGAAGFGCDAVLCVGACADVWAPKALRAAMGATFRVPQLAPARAWADARRELERAGLRACAADGSAGACAHYDVDWTAPAAVLVGSEGAGLSADVREDVRAGTVAPVAIPMAAGLESLNAAMAGTVILAEAARQRAAAAGRRTGGAVGAGGAGGSASTRHQRG